MKFHLASLLLLLASAVLYLVGFGSGMALVLGAAVALEMYFWVRVVRRKARPYPPVRQAP